MHPATALLFVSILRKLINIVISLSLPLPHIELGALALPNMELGTAKTMSVLLKFRVNWVSQWLHFLFQSSNWEKERPPRVCCVLNDA